MRYGDILPEGFNIPTSAFWLRKDLTPEGNPFKLVEIRTGDKVMDCGAYIGTFAAACMEQGAESVACYEAAPKNAALLRENMKRYPHVQVVEGALTTKIDVETVVLTMSGFSGANSILPSPNRKKSISVIARYFRFHVLDLAPTIIKLDVEGAEYDLLDSLQSGDLMSVRTVFIEFHPIADRDARIERVKKYLTTEKFTIISTRRRAFVATKETA